MSKLKQVQRRWYDPPAADEWPGRQNFNESVSEHVQENRPRKTLVLEDPSGVVGSQLLDNMFRGKKSIIVPSMETLKLSKDISKSVGLKASDALGLNELGSLMKDATKPPRFPLDHFLSRSTTRPFVCIVDVPKRASEKEAVVILTDTSRLQAAAGTSIVTIICPEKKYNVRNLPLVLPQFDIVS